MRHETPKGLPSDEEGEETAARVPSYMIRLVTFGRAAGRWEKRLAGLSAGE
jgi:hypothetical protein